MEGTLTHVAWSIHSLLYLTRSIDLRGSEKYLSSFTLRGPTLHVNYCLTTTGTLNFNITSAICSFLLSEDDKSLRLYLQEERRKYS